MVSHEFKTPVHSQSIRSNLSIFKLHSLSELNKAVESLMVNGEVSFHHSNNVLYIQDFPIICLLTFLTFLRALLFDIFS